MRIKQPESTLALAQIVLAPAPHFARAASDDVEIKALRRISFPNRRISFPSEGYFAQKPAGVVVATFGWQDVKAFFTRRLSNGNFSFVCNLNDRAL